MAVVKFQPSDKKVFGFAINVEWQRKKRKRPRRTLLMLTYWFSSVRCRSGDKGTTQT